MKKHRKENSAQTLQNLAQPRFGNSKLILVDLEVNLGNKKRHAPTLCASIDGKIIPLSTAHDGRPVLMNLENALEQ